MKKCMIKPENVPRKTEKAVPHNTSEYGRYNSKLKSTSNERFQ